MLSLNLFPFVLLFIFPFFYLLRRGDILKGIIYRSKRENKEIKQIINNYSEFNQPSNRSIEENKHDNLNNGLKIKLEDSNNSITNNKTDIDINSQIEQYSINQFSNTNLENDVDEKGGYKTNHENSKLNKNGEININYMNNENHFVKDSTLNNEIEIRNEKDADDLFKFSDNQTVYHPHITSTITHEQLMDEFLNYIRFKKEIKLKSISEDFNNESSILKNLRQVEREDEIGIYDNKGIYIKLSSQDFEVNFK